MHRQLKGDDNISKETPMPIKEKPQDFCEVVHIGIVCTGYKSSLLFHNLLKSILFHRVNPIHFHVITDRSTENVLNTLMNSWALPQGNFLNIKKINVIICVI